MSFNLNIKSKLRKFRINRFRCKEQKEQSLNWLVWQNLKIFVKKGDRKIQNSIYGNKLACIWSYVKTSSTFSNVRVAKF